MILDVLTLIITTSTFTLVVLNFWRDLGRPVRRPVRHRPVEALRSGVGGFRLSTSEDEVREAMLAAGKAIRKERGEP